jgi:hypothetical protein
MAKAAVTTKQFITKDMVNIPKGSLVTKWCPVIAGSRQDTLCVVGMHTVKIQDVFTAPSISSLERQVDNGVVKSILGHRTEPDGFDPEGSPSWALALSIC